MASSKEYLKVRWIGGSSDGKGQLVEKKWCVTPTSGLTEGQEVQIKIRKEPRSKGLGRGLPGSWHNW